MKSLTIALALFALLLTGIFLNAIYINEETSRWSKLAESLDNIESESFEQRFNAFESEWKNFKRIADISCQYSDLNRIDMTIKEMKARAETDSPEDYETARQTLIFLLSELSRLERLSPEGLI